VTANGHGRVSRARVVGRFLSLYEDARYLEVGVSKARTFDRVQAAVKVAVDPVFRFDPDAAERRVPGVSYHQVTSDEFFGSVVEPDQQFDVIYVDGLHTVEQTLRDLLNALHHLQPRGVVVIDDTRPPTALAAIPDREEFFAERRRLGAEDQGAWMGDVFRLVWFIDTFCQQLSHRTVANNHGQTVVWRQRRLEVPPRELARVGAMSWEEMRDHEDVLRLAPLGEIVREVRLALGLPKPRRRAPVPIG